MVGTDGVGTGAAATLSAGLLEQGLLAHVAALPADASAFVDSVYVSALGVRPGCPPWVSALGRPTQGDAGGWVAALDAGAARPQIALAIADSVEGRL